jgi:hypothetical protein
MVTVITIFLINYFTITKYLSYTNDYNRQPIIMWLVSPVLHVTTSRSAPPIPLLL